MTNAGAFVAAADLRADRDRLARELLEAKKKIAELEAKLRG